jgi:hypothetical protein
MRIFLFMLIFLLPKFSEAQLAFGMQSAYQQANYFSPKDSTKADTLPRKKMAPPKKAAIMSACLPGLGQIYNHKWWKVPIIYAGFGGLTYGFIWNQGYVADYRNALRLRYDDDSTTIDQFPRYSDNDLVTLKNYYQRYRDLCVIGAAALYTLQIIDAAVDAHLATFDVSDDLSMNISPGMIYAGGARAPGIGIRLFYR